MAANPSAGTPISLGRLSVLMLTASATLPALAISPFACEVGGQELPTIKEKTAHLESQDGFFPIHYDSADGRLYLEVSLPGEEFLYHSFVAAGDGLAMARGTPNWLAGPAIVRFERRGSELVLVETDVGTDPSVEAQGPSNFFLEGDLPIVAEEAGRVLVDGTGHFLQDAHSWPGLGISGVPGVLSEFLGEEDFHLDLGQSSIFRPSTRSTPESTEVEALLTFVTDQPGAWARSFLPDSATFVVRQRHSLSRPPEPGLPIRRSDPRMGFSRSPVMVSRWQLEKLDPAMPVSEVVEPIAVYLDAAMPEDVLEAARLGVEYWNRVFEGLGFKNALLVGDLPAEADPLDPKFPVVVLWTPDQVASAGYSVADRRTGEKVKGVILEAGRRRHLGENFYRAIEPVLEPGQPDLRALLRSQEAWVVAHEAGHVLAPLAHNNLVPSVMGIHRPRLRVGASGGLEMDLSVLYPAEPFPYDEWMMRYVYTPLEPGEEEEEGLLQIVEDGFRKGLQFSGFGQGRNPRAHSYMHSDDPLTVLEEDMAVRRLLLERFGPDMLHPGESESLLFERLIPVYFHHRRSLRAVATVLGGVELHSGPANDYQGLERVIDSRTQRRALDAILNALSPEELLIPSRIAAIIPPKLESSPLSDVEGLVRGDPSVFGYGIDPPIYLPLQTEGPFDPLGWVGVLSNMMVRQLLWRAPRVAYQHSSGETDLSVEEILNRLVDETWGTPTPELGSLADVARLVRGEVLDGMILMAEREETREAVAETIRRTLDRLLTDLRSRTTDDPAERAHVDAAIQKIAEIG
jgi:hypothetical protein